MTENLIKLRHHIHQHPELSGVEFETADLLKSKLETLNPDEIITGIGGCGVAAKFTSSEDGPTILFRAELDALPIEEINDFSYRSVNKGVSHKCGHDGHMSIIFGLAEKIAKNRPQKGSVVILFQPAEETGEGGRFVVADQKFKDLETDYCYALHNLPGHPMGQVMIRTGTFNCASRGMIIKLSGKTAHAAYPETGISPAQALSELLAAFPNIADTIDMDELLMSTTVHSSMGECAFGTAPSDAVFMVTLRSESNEGMAKLVEKSEELVKKAAQKHSLSHSIEWADVFDASVNHEECVEHVAKAAQKTNHDVAYLDEPFRWSEDFGAISASASGAMFAFGAGEENPQIHNPDYDFPDELIERGVSIFYQIYSDHLL
ncbi:amidohydrolase [Pseudemcibacter aquimaris]|uniref:amidohydrolase n=1 Tax=Pseudemcibacter aquimaris TaxID=2857064 RepID=UPI00201165D6|nr:amidohydrolase [Pseudemcibacter aquimaris]MCC3861186.1 amidohydrolase [Pseudemcibacter aquimaris]WDU57961.1 amidohydrolase [Pseudemcibacter aquimaris]